MPKTTRAVLAALAVALAVPILPSQAAPPPLLDAEVERAVRDYLLREPEILEQAIQALQKRREAQAAVAQKEAIAARADDVFRNAADPVGGNPRGDVTLVEFFDYGCGYCKSVAPMLRGLLERDKGVRLVFKEMTVFGRDSAAAAKLALAAHALDPARYPALHFALMGLEARGRDALLLLAAQHGYDRDRIAAAMDGPEVQARIDANMELGHALNIQGTPTFLIGGEIVPGVADADHLAALVAAERSKAQATGAAAPAQAAGAG